MDQIFILHLIVGFLLISCEGARILGVFPVTSISHQVVFRPLLQELARRGHEIVILTPNPAFPAGQAPKNIREIDLSHSYKPWEEHFVKKPTHTMEVIYRAFIEVFDDQLKNEDVNKLIKSNEKFDLVFSESIVRVGLILSHVFKAPVIQISSLGAIPPNYETIGAPSHPILYPDCTGQKFYNLTLFDRLYALYYYFEFQNLQKSLEENENALIRKHFGENVPTVSELTNNVDMLFLNINPVWEGNRAVPPGVIHMGGLHLKPPNSLPEDIQNFLDKSKNGVIYMSLGTNVDPSRLPEDRLDVFRNVFAKLPYDVLIKWNGDELPKKPENVVISKWFPQADLLRHPKVKLFIMQGGLQSLDEAIAAGIPLIAFPMLGDQWYNAQKIAHLKIGIQLDMWSVTEDSLKNAIEVILNNTSYRENIANLRDIMQDQPQTPLERAVWWTEYVIRHNGARHLRNALANISWTEFLMLDVIATVLISSFMIIYSIIAVIRKILCRKSNSKIKSN